MTAQERNALVEYLSTSSDITVETYGGSTLRGEYASQWYELRHRYYPGAFRFYPEGLFLREPRRDNRITLSKTQTACLLNRIQSGGKIDR